MVSILYGNEPYIIMKRKNKLIDTLHDKQMNFHRYEGEFNAEIYNACIEYPFLENRKVVLLEVEALSAVDKSLFWKYLERPADSTDLLIICKEVDRKTKLYKKLNSLKIIIPCNKMDNETLQNAILYELSQKEGSIQKTALLELINRLDYENESSVNMLSIVGYIDNMLAIDKGITLEMVDRFVPKNESANVFGLSKMLLQKASTELLRELEMISPDEAISVLSLLLRDFRIAYKLKYFEKKEIADKGVFTSFSGYSTDTLVKCMTTITDTITDVKSGKTTNQQAVKLACIKLFNLL